MLILKQWFEGLFFENMNGKYFQMEKRVLGKGYVVLFIVVMPLIHILNKTSNKSKYSRKMEKGS